MKPTMMFLGLALAWSALSPRSVEAQYPLLNPDDPCYEVITVHFWVPLDDQAELWGDSDALGIYHSALLHTLRRELETIKQYKPDSNWTKEEKEAEIRAKTTAKNCVPTLVAMIRRIDERLKSLGIDQIMDASRRHVAREEVTRQLVEVTEEYEAALEMALKSLGGRE